MSIASSSSQYQLSGLIADSNLSLMLSRISGFTNILSTVPNHYIHIIQTNPAPHLRISSNFIEKRLKTFIPFSKRHWKLAFYNKPEPTKKTSVANNRVIIQTPIETADPLILLEDLGAEFHHEYLEQGYVFQYPISLIVITIKVIKLFTLEKRYQVSSAILEPAFEDRWLILLLAGAHSSDDDDDDASITNDASADPKAINEAMITLASFFKGIVDLVPVNHLSLNCL